MLSSNKIIPFSPWTSSGSTVCFFLSHLETALLIYLEYLEHQWSLHGFGKWTGRVSRRIFRMCKFLQLFLLRYLLSGTKDKLGSSLGAQPQWEGQGSTRGNIQGIKTHAHHQDNWKLTLPKVCYWEDCQSEYSSKEQQRRSPRKNQIKQLSMKSVHKGIPDHDKHCTREG